MVINLQIPWKRIFIDLRVQMVIIVVYMTGISIVDHYLPLNEIHVPIALITVPGTVIALLLGFRTNSAYDRWWEARIIWGAIVNDSRTWVRQLLTFVKFKSKTSPEYLKIRKMALRHVVWNYALTKHLRKKNVLADIKGLLDDEELTLLASKTNIPNALLYNQGADIKELFADSLIDAYQHVQLDETLVRFTDSMGKCERIKNTVFPASYSLLVDILIYLWILFLPFGLVDMIGYILIPTTISLAFSFLVIDRIAVYMQDPFENMPSDTPMLSLSRNIEINIRQELGDQIVPELIPPKNGIMM